MQDLSEDIVLLGQVSGLFGVKGWVKVFSYTEPRENIVQYSPWLVKTDKGWKQIKLNQGKRQGKSVIASLQGYDDPDSASTLIGCDIGMRREQLPALTDDEFYWNDLVGLTVINQDGIELGQVQRLIETGSNDVLVVQGDRERLVPYIKEQVIKHIDLEQKLIRVDWDPEF